MKVVYYFNDGKAICLTAKKKKKEKYFAKSKKIRIFAVR